ncbi:hypothetical protein AB0B01_07350 [Streptomyces sp. NPDC044571]|uniref:hypothetical protein n=1 Tax=Streptomyces sp. NPDC044571 TaxID=3155371 RepID=UPI0033CE4908
MSRTAHHIRSRRAADAPADVPLTVLVRDLRFSARCRAEAGRAGRRPRPRALRRLAEIRSRPRRASDPSVARWAAEEQRRARQRLRARARAALRLVDAGRGMPLDLVAAADVDIPPARHRRAALWLA